MSDWRYAKDAIGQRLADAREREEFATKIYDSAKANLDEARDKVRAAEEMLKDAERKWPEIEIGDDEALAASPTTPPKKRRGNVSMSLSSHGCHRHRDSNLLYCL